MSSLGSVLGGGGGASNQIIFNCLLFNSYRVPFQNDLVDHRHLRQMKSLQILVRHHHQYHHLVHQLYLSILLNVPSNSMLVYLVHHLKYNFKIL